MEERKIVRTDSVKAYSSRRWGWRLRGLAPFESGRRFTLRPLHRQTEEILHGLHAITSSIHRDLIRTFEQLLRHALRLGFIRAHGATKPGDLFKF